MYDGISQHSEAADERAVLYDGLAPELHRGMNGDVAADLDLRPNPDARRVHAVHAVVAHQRKHYPVAHDARRVRKLYLVVDAEELLRVVRVDRLDLSAARRDERERVGEVILALRVLARYFVDYRDERRGAEYVHAAVDLVDGALRFRRVLMLDDADAAVFCYHAAVAGRVCEREAEEAAVVAARYMAFSKIFESFGGYERSVAREHEHVFIRAPPLLRELRRVARAALFALPDYRCFREVFSDPALDRFAFVADDHRRLAEAGVERRFKGIVKNRFLKHQMEDLGSFAAHARAFARGQH